ncbi:MAG: nitrous oxide reductase accessory protein NosL [Flavobacteriales bacterium]|nr:nitrous oxide reductase accessory protein NosL [Flavobacteriales bacterium]
MLMMLFILPMWKIELDAPQYPEGLELKIFVNHLGGDVEVINGLNHYIGMRTLHDEEFPEFAILPYIIGALVLISLAAFLRNRVRWINLYFLTFILIAVVSMADFYWWEYDYGHDLDPTAPIKVPGSSYQPPFIGYKKLLNFGAYSVPDSGGWFFIGAGVVLAAAWYVEFRRSKRKKGQPKPGRISNAVLLVVGLFWLNACNSGPKPIEVGKDACGQCKMTITDARFGAEIITRKGKVYKFDDLVCVLDCIKYGEVKKEDVASVWCADYLKPEHLIKADEAVYLSGENLRSPMGGNMAAFSTAQARDSVLMELGGYAIDWKDIYH